MKNNGMGRYAPIERALNRLGSDRVNELYLSGELDKIYEEFDRTGKVRIKKSKKGGKR